MDAGPDALEREARNIVPVEPDENGLAPDVVVGDEAPVAAVVAVVPIVAHHQVATGRHLAAEPAIIVNAVLLPGERAHVERIDGLGRRILRDRVALAVPALG